ncbi:MAG: M16 family metallopeptidase, partial [Thermoanaerobaculia bacterium]
SQDRTNYYDEGPAHLLPALLYLEADRMEGFGRAIDLGKLDLQRGVVRNERRQSYENRPYGKALLAKWALLYPPSHPYREPVIGSHQDLENATVADVRSFFERFYVPANASLVVAGDFEAEETRALVRRYFGKIPAGSRAPAPAVAPAALSGEVRETLRDRVQLARVGFFYHSPAIFAEGDADLDIAGSILGEGKSSRLYRALVYERRLAQDVAAQQTSHLLGSLFEVMATARPGVEPAALERALDEEIEKLAASPPSAEEVERARSRYEVEFWERVESLGERADLLNHYQFHFGTPGGIERDLGRYRSVTPRSVSRWARKVLRKDARVVLSVVPEG